MNWHKDDAPPGSGGGKRGYHHGNLREALVKAALDLIASKGTAGFTFAEAARQAGVSPAAPYRHYRDRDALIADVALLGFRRFAEALTSAWNEGRPTPLAAFDRLGRAYLAFARAEPSLYAAMFEAGLDLKQHPELHAAGDQALGVLRGACETLAATLPPGSRPPALMMSLHVWAMSHGIASLFGRGDGARRVTPIAAEELLESAMLLYLQGLGFKPSETAPPDSASR